MNRPGGIHVANLKPFSCTATSTDVCVTFTLAHSNVIFSPPCFRVCSLVNKCFKIGNALVFSLSTHVLLSLEGVPWARSPCKVAQTQPPGHLPAPLALLCCPTCSLALTNSLLTPRLVIFTSPESHFTVSEFSCRC